MHSEHPPAGLRLFIAFDTPAHVREEAARLIGELRESHADVRWEVRDKLHVTLKFLGDTPAGQLPEVMAALRAAASDVGAIRIRYRGLGTFPPRGVPRIFWVGIEDPAGALVPLARRIDEEMGKLGYPREERPFHPHLTLGRVRSPRNLGALQNRLISCTFESQPATVDGLMLVRSDLTPTGSVYTTLELLPLSV